LPSPVCLRAVKAYATSHVKVDLCIGRLPEVSYFIGYFMHFYYKWMHFMDYKTETAIHCHYKAWKSQGIFFLT